MDIVAPEESQQEIENKVIAVMRVLTFWQIINIESNITPEFLLKV